MNKITASIVIPVYNAEKFLRPCLDTVLNQSFRDTEIIAVNDGSTDSSLEILEVYAKIDSRLRVITTQDTGLGAGAARNAGLDQATGKYIIFLDADDFFAPVLIEELVSRAEAVNADIVVCATFGYDDKNGKIFERPFELDESYLPDKDVFSHKDAPDCIFRFSNGVVWNKLYRQSFLQKTKLRFQTNVCLDDTNFVFLSYMLAERITVINKRLIYYRYNVSNSQTERIGNNPESICAAFYALKDALVGLGLYEIVKRSYVNMAVELAKWNLEKIADCQAFTLLYDKLKNEFFEKTDIIGNEQAYFYLKSHYIWVRLVSVCTATEYLFEQASDFPTKMFPFPEDIVPAGARIVLYGAGEVGRNYFRQLIKSLHCRVVLWADKAFEELGGNVSSPHLIQSARYDYVVIAVESEEIAGQIKADLIGRLGVEEKKIVYAIGGICGNADGQ
ncbi:MAG: glycosyltransferase [Gracilibacteraceae bacterium]|jgi:glycosyltransferase involved in cell wall biosynthesis|nr:glycosyltransferase [Gracilibacteraceae bacterium]